MSKELKKEDGRVTYTKMRIRSAFYDLLHEMEPNKITVTAVCKKAEINRATFYKHYLDVPDLVERLQTDAINELSQKLDAADIHHVEGFMVEMLKLIRENIEGEFFGAIFHSSKNYFTSEITTLIYLKFSGYIDPLIPPESKLSKSIVFSYISSGAAGIIDYWVKTGYKETEEAIAEIIIQLTSSTLKNL